MTYVITKIIMLPSVGTYFIIIQVTLLNFYTQVSTTRNLCKKKIYFCKFQYGYWIFLMSLYKIYIILYLCEV